jgi:branched-chain amino acid transport system permease protein
MQIQYRQLKNIFILFMTLILIGVLISQLLSNYRIFQINNLMINALIILSLNLLVGYGGQLSLSQGAFYAIGAYTSAILVQHFDVYFLWTIPLAGLASGTISLLFVLPLLRLSGTYFVLITFCLAASLPAIIKYFSSWTGATEGMNIPALLVPFKLPISSDLLAFICIFTISAGLFILARILTSSTFGLTLKAIRDNQIAALSIGINVAMYKTIILIISSFYAGVAGSLLILNTHFISADMFPIEISIIILTGSMIGGLNSIIGAIFGALFITMVPNITSDISHSIPMLIYGVILLLCISFMPRGFVFLMYSWLRRT